MNELDGEEYAVVTVNLNHPMQSDDSMAFLDENYYPGIGALCPQRCKTQGFCTRLPPIPGPEGQIGAVLHPAPLFLRPGGAKEAFFAPRRGDR